MGKGAAVERARTEADTIVLLGGAPLKSEIEDAAAEAEAGADEDNAAAGSNDNATKDPDGADAAEDKAKVQVDDEKTRKMRVRRAKQILKVLNKDTVDDAPADVPDDRPP